MQPRIEVTPNAFKLVLPNTNTAIPVPSESSSKEQSALNITPQMEAVLEYLAEYKEMGDEELQELLNVKRTRAYLVARQMIEQGLITSSGRGASKRYRLK